MTSLLSIMNRLIKHSLQSFPVWMILAAYSAAVPVAAPAQPCAGAVDLTGETLPMFLPFDTATLSEALSAPCAPTDAPGPEAWYQLPALAEGTTYFVSTGGGETGNVSAITLAVYAGGCEETDLVACSYGSAEGGLGRVQFKAEGTGPWFALVEMSVPGQTGPFTLALHEDPDTNADAQCLGAVIPFDDVPFEFPIDLTDGDNVDGVPCGPDTGGADRWLELPAVQGGAIYTVETRPVAGSPTLDTRLAVFAGSSCSALVPVGCNDDIDIDAGNLFSRVVFVAVEGQTYKVHVETAEAAQDGAFILAVSKTDPLVGETCDRGIPVSLAALPLEVEIDLSAGNSVVGAPCDPTLTGADQWLVLSDMTDFDLLTAEVIPADPPTALDDTNLALFSGPCEALSLIACNDNIEDGVNNLSLINFIGDSSQSLHLLAEAADPDKLGRVKVRFTSGGIASPPANDICPTAAIIDPSITFYENTVFARLAEDDGSFALFGGPADGPDIFFRFTPAATGPYIISGEFTGTAQQMAIGVYSTPSCSVAFTPVCASPVIAAQPVMVAQLTMGTQYYIVADTPETGPVIDSYTVRVEAPPGTGPSANPICEFAGVILVLPFNDTQNPAENPSSLDLAGPEGGQYCLGEIYYEFTPAFDRVIRATATSAGGQAVLIGLYQGACGSLAPAARLAVNQGIFHLSAGQKYYIVVEPWAARPEGVISLTVTDVLPPGNDECSAATPVAVLPYVAQVDVLAALDEGLDATCDITFDFESRKDVFWQFTPAVTGHYRIDAGVPGLFGSGLNTAIAILDGCSAPNEIACVDNTLAGEFLVAELTGGVTYFILVDIKEPDEPGPPPANELLDFSIRAVDDPVGEDSCAAARVLSTADLPVVETLDLASHNAHPFLLEQGPVQGYRLTAHRWGIVRATAKPQTDGVDAALALTNQSCDLPDASFFFKPEESVVDDFGPRSGSGPGQTGEETFDFALLEGETAILYVLSQDGLGGPTDISLLFEPLPQIDAWWMY